MFKDVNFVQLLTQIIGHPRAVNENSQQQVGDKAPDGWIYIGVSTETGRPTFAAPADAGQMHWDDAEKGAAELRKQGVVGARLGSKGDLGLMFDSAAHVSGLDKKAPYWGAELDATGALLGSADGTLIAHKDYQLPRNATDERPRPSVRYIRG